MVNLGTILYYSGDIDSEGMQIADKLKEKFKDKINLVGFDIKMYQENKSLVKLSDIRLKKLDLLKDEKLKELAKIVKKEGVAAYEEKGCNTGTLLFGTFLY